MITFSLIVAYFAVIYLAQYFTKPGASLLRMILEFSIIVTLEGGILAAIFARVNPD